MAIQRWYKLDNAAKIFPPVSSKRRTNIFRLSFEMKEEVDPLILQKALEIVIERFPMFKVKLKKGIFWYYLELNKAYAPLHKESSYICRMIENYDDNRGYLFRLSYYYKRIALETFHSLTDGFGALEFLKSIVYTYLELQDVTIKENISVLTKDVEVSVEEKQDSFNFHYNPKLKKPPKEEKALQFKSQQYSENWVGVITGTVDVNEIKKLASNYNATITEYLAACLFLCAYKSRHLLEQKSKPFTIFIPVNLRRFFDSKTLRNFSLYVRTSLKLDKELELADIIEVVKKDMANGVDKEKLHAMFVNNVRKERNLFVRIVPMFIKELILKLGYYLLGDSVNTLSFSNLGVVRLPEEMAKHIDKIIFANGASFSSPLNLGVISVNDKMTITFSSKLVDRSLQKEYFRFLSDQGINVTIEHNELEVD
ncbi:MAG TPA: hypothetical protein GXZ48_06285 [Acholeplasmataceae bacterium]|nr:hypothetical protein [Acholeplasmataceae bacterium]